MLLGKAQVDVSKQLPRGNHPQVTGEETSAGTVSVWLLDTLVPFSGMVSQARLPSTSYRTCLKEKGDRELQPPWSTPLSFHLQELPPHPWGPPHPARVVIRVGQGRPEETAALSAGPGLPKSFSTWTHGQYPGFSCLPTGHVSNTS